MEDAVTCVVCCRVYQKAIRDPLVLPCGHTFCRSCISAVQSNSPGSLVCPTCRGDSGITDISRLPICYPLVGLSSNYSDFKFGSCRKHGEEEERFWCLKCEMPLCSMCLYNDHKKGHSITPIKTAMEGKKQQLDARLSRLRGKVMEGKEEIEDMYHYLTTKIKQVLRMEEKLDLLTDEVDEACCVEDIVDCENKINAMDEESVNWLPKLDATKREPKTANEEDQKIIEDKLLTMNLDSDAYGDDLDATDEGAEGRLYNFEDMRRTRRMRVDFKEGRLLLHSIAHPAGDRLSVKVPSEVFLELGVNGICLGRVYISLWCHLRRAQQFLALCIGTLGPSYVGSFFSHVAYQERPKETLCCKEYWTNQGPNTKDLLADLEWGDEYRKEPQPGLLIPLSKFPDQHGFGICTRGNPEGSFHCPFGEVVGGMDVVLRAVQHHPVTSVAITHCGVVLSDSLSQ